MFEWEREIAKWRASVIRQGGISQECVEELESHLIDRFEELAKNWPEEDAFQRALELMGDGRELGAEFGKVEPLISIENSMKNLMFGSVIAIVGLLMGVFMMGGNLSTYFHPPEFVALILVPVGITISSFGFSRMGNAVRCVLGGKDFSNASMTVLKRWISGTYATGGLTFLIGLALAFSHLDKPHFGAMISASFSALIYAIVISELLLRSTLSKLQEHAE